MNANDLLTCFSLGCYHKIRAPNSVLQMVF